MNKYELTIVAKPTLEEEVLNTEFAQIQELIERFGGTVEKVDDWGKRRLAYEIQKTMEGVYRFVTFTAPASTPTELEGRMRIRENLLRYLIVKEEA